MSPPRPLDVDHTLPEQGMILRAHDLDVQEHVAFQRARSVCMQHKCRIAGAAVAHNAPPVQVQAEDLEAGMAVDGPGHACHPVTVSNRVAVVTKGHGMPTVQLLYHLWTHRSASRHHGHKQHPHSIDPVAASLAVPTEGYAGSHIVASRTEEDDSVRAPRWRAYQLTLEAPAVPAELGTLACIDRRSTISSAETEVRLEEGRLQIREASARITDIFSEQANITEPIPRARIIETQQGPVGTAPPMTPYRSFMRTYPRTDPAQEEPRALAPAAQAARALAVPAAVFPRQAIHPKAGSGPSSFPYQRVGPPDMKPCCCLSICRSVEAVWIKERVVHDALQSQSQSRPQSQSQSQSSISISISIPLVFVPPDVQPRTRGKTYRWD